MAGPTVFEDVADEFALDGVGQLFTGKRFWVAQRVPGRVKLLDDIKANGGEVVLLEKKADYRIADRFRKDCPPGTISYEFITKSIADGRLHDPEDHPAGPPEGEARMTGDLHRPGKGTRTTYTPEEDRICYKWVRDCVAGGGMASGNEIYKQLEAKYPRHPWQSWRDRYIKQLRDRPPSAFNIPDNAPPSPPSDNPTEQARQATAATRLAIQAATNPAQSQVPKKVTGQGKVRDVKSATPPDYTLGQLAATFNSEDWEELYAYVDVISAMEDKSLYDKAWRQWAQAQDNQTAEQWRQYYEKVVRPQWLRDPQSKRTQVKEKVEKRHEETASQSQALEQLQQADVLEEKEVVGAVPAVTEVQTPIVDAPTTKTHETSSEEPSKLSSSTAQHESPKYITALRQDVLKRAREDNPEEHEQVGQSPPAKRQRSLSPVVKPAPNDTAQAGTPKQPVEIFSSESSSSDEEEAEQEQVKEQIKQDVEQSQHNDHVMLEDEELEDDVESIELEEFPSADQSPSRPEDFGEPSEDDLPSNTPTPRAPRLRPNNFDTQAILSSPSQDIRIGKLPRPLDFTQAIETQADRSSSLAPHLDSDASTTQSMQEFRRSLNGEGTSQPMYPTLVTLPRAPSFSPTPSNSSDISEDPDPPLSAHEIDAFFATQNALGLSDPFIAAALKRTRCRPALAEIVLDAWKEGKPLPHQRGIWSLEDDEAAESGDGLELAQLERKHTLDGWGGITERLRFLEGYRSR